MSATILNIPFTPEELRKVYNGENGKNITRGAIGNVLRYWIEISFVKKLIVNQREIRGFYIVNKKKA